ncbi:MAG TPA: hypothetical protein VFH39_03765 [Candidatus Saccharimonadales bacterium]|nr:hypothetical protein [Candidatus Saccharimonadales bacterium]
MSKLFTPENSEQLVLSPVYPGKQQTAERLDQLLAEGSGWGPGADGWVSDHSPVWTASLRDNPVPVGYVYYGHHAREPRVMVYGGRTAEHLPNGEPLTHDIRANVSAALLHTALNDVRLPARLYVAPKVSLPGAVMENLNNRITPVQQVLGELALLHPWLALAETPAE